MRRLATGSPRSIRFASCTSSAAVSSLWRPTSARKSWSESAAPVSDSAGPHLGLGGLLLLLLPSRARACGAPISSPIVSSSRVSASASSSLSSCSRTNASSSAGSTKPRSSERSMSRLSCSDSNSSISWFCVKRCVSPFACLGVHAQSLCSLDVSFPVLSRRSGRQAVSRTPQRVRSMRYSAASCVRGLIAHESCGGFVRRSSTC